MRVSIAALLVPATLLATAPLAAQREVTVRAATVQSLDAKLRAFQGGLSPAEQGILVGLLKQAAGAPSDPPGGVQVRPAFYAPAGGPGVTLETAGSGGGTHIIVQGGSPRGIIVQGGRTAIGPKPDDPRAPNRAASHPQPRPQGGTAAIAIGPKQDDPAHGLAIGPKQDDPAHSLAGKMHGFAQTLNPDEQAAFDWFLQRAASNSRPGGNGPTPTLSQALGINAIGPKPDDPRAAGAGVLLKF